MENKPEIFPNITFRQKPPLCVWTPEEHDKFSVALKQHGRNFGKIIKAVGSKTRTQVYNYTAVLKRKLKSNPDHEHADLMAFLEKRATKMTDEE